MAPDRGTDARNGNRWHAVRCLGRRWSEDSPTEPPQLASTARVMMAIAEFVELMGPAIKLTAMNTLAGYLAAHPMLQARSFSAQPHLDFHGFFTLASGWTGGVGGGTNGGS